MVIATRFSISIDPKLLGSFDKTIAKKGYKTRSDAVSDVLRHYVMHSGSKEMLATISVLYNHKQNRFIPLIEQEYPCLVRSSQKLSHGNNHIYETMILKGPKERIEKFFISLRNSNGIIKANLNIQ